MYALNLVTTNYSNFLYNTVVGPIFHEHNRTKKIAHANIGIIASGYVRLLRSVCTILQVATGLEFKYVIQKFITLDAVKCCKNLVTTKCNELEGHICSSFITFHTNSIYCHPLWPLKCGLLYMSGMIVFYSRGNTSASPRSISRIRPG